MANIGDKFIITIGDKAENEQSGEILYRIKGFKSLVFDENGIEKLEKYEGHNVKAPTEEPIGVSLIGTHFVNGCIGFCRFKDTSMNGDLISRDDLINNKPEFMNEKVVRDTKYRTAKDRIYARAWNACNSYWLNAIKNASTVEEVEEPFITECRNTAIEKNLPLYFVYYKETGVFEVYVTKTKELFEKRHCYKHLSDYEFRNLTIQYLDEYSDWEGVWYETN